MSIVSETELVSINTPALPDPGKASKARVASDGGAEIKRQSPSTRWAINQAAFDQLLCWLGPDRESAGREYELIRHKLITLFTCKGCVFPEDLADETFNRVARKLPKIKPYYCGKPARYFYGVAKRISMEYLRRKSAPHHPPAPDAKEDLEELFQHLDHALGKLGRADRELILNYYEDSGRGKIDHRKAMADELGVDMNVLRLRVYRIRSKLRGHLKMENCGRPICQQYINGLTDGVLQ